MSGLDQPLRYVLVGTTSFLLEYSIYVVVVRGLEWHYLIANTLAFVAANVYVYLLSRGWVFGIGKHGIAREIGYFCVALGIGLALSQLVLWLLVEYSSLGFYTAKVLAVCAVVGFNFPARKYVVFTR